MRAALLSILLCACASSPGMMASEDVAATDLTTPSSDVIDATSDASDAASDVRDVARLDRPAIDAPVADGGAEDVALTPEDVVIDPGMCGPSVRACFCACGANGVCQQGCIGRDQDCGFCVYLAATRCCPAQSDALDRCIDRSMCNDDPCIRERCAGEVGAFEGCFASAQMTEPACQSQLRMCLGSDYPMVRCVMRQ